MTILALAMDDQGDRCALGHLICLKLLEPGQEVKSGESVAIAEAMKMQNIIRAERDGVISKVHVAAGASVAADEVMIELA